MTKKAGAIMPTPLKWSLTRNFCLVWKCDCQKSENCAKLYSSVLLNQFRAYRCCCCA